MDIIRNIEAAFHPELYPQRLSLTPGLSLCLVRKQGLSRYVLAVLDFDSKSDMKAQISKARKIIRKQTGALWLFKEVGAYIVFITDKLPKIDRSSLAVDSTGFHAVIVQGIHIVSGSGQHLFNHTEWLNQQFGGTESITDIIVTSTR